MTLMAKLPAEVQKRLDDYLAGRPVEPMKKPIKTLTGQPKEK